MIFPLLVRKYRDSQDIPVTNKLRKLNLKSVKKKSARMTLRLATATGLQQSENVDSEFNKVEARYVQMVLSYYISSHPSINLAVLMTRYSSYCVNTRIFADIRKSSYKHLISFLIFNVDSYVTIWLIFFQ